MNVHKQNAVVCISEDATSSLYSTDSDPLTLVQPLADTNINKLCSYAQPYLPIESDETPDQTCSGCGLWTPINFVFRKSRRAGHRRFHLYSSPELQSPYDAATFVPYQCLPDELTKTPRIVECKLTEHPFPGGKGLTFEDRIFKRTTFGKFETCEFNNSTDLCASSATATGPNRPRNSLISATNEEFYELENLSLISDSDQESRQQLLQPTKGSDMTRSRLSKLADRLATDSEPGLDNVQLFLTNHDLKPVEPERRQWGAWNFVGFWVSDCFNVNTWLISSSMISEYGLSWWQSWICVWIGYAISGAFICLTGRIGAQYHIGFPVVTRASFGIWGALWPVLNRATMAAVWYGIQSWIGGQCVYLMIRAIWQSFADLPNTLKGTPGLSTKYFVSFIIFWIGSLPFLWFPVHKIRHLFTVKSFIVPPAGIAFLIWICVKSGGIGPIVHQPGTASGSVLAWGVIKGIMASISNFATLIVNDPDFARFARKPRDALWSQLITIPVGFAVTSFIGIVVSSSSTILYGKPIWNPLDLLSRILDEGGAGPRAGVFLIAMAFCLAQLGTNIAANSVSAGTDMTALLPRYLNIRRGSYICAIIGLCINPWYLLSSASSFTTYLSAYSVFLSSIAGVIICDYYAIRKGYLTVTDLYSAQSSGPYWYTFGINWRAYVAYICGIAINVTGFAGAVGTKVPVGASYIYNLNFFTGFIVAFTIYFGLCKMSPIPGTSDSWHEIGDTVRNPSLAYVSQESPMFDEQSFKNYGKEDVTPTLDNKFSGSEDDDL